MGVAGRVIGIARAIATVLLGPTCSPASRAGLKWMVHAGQLVVLALTSDGFAVRDYRSVLLYAQPNRDASQVHRS